MKLLLTFLSIITLTFGTSSITFAAETVPPTAPAVESAAVEKQDAVNINTADVAELTKLKGVGEKKAEAIVVWRKENGNFKTVDQLLEVKGIGEATLNANREMIRI